MVNESGEQRIPRVFDNVADMDSDLERDARRYRPLKRGKQAYPCLCFEELRPYRGALGFDKRSSIVRPTNCSQWPTARGFRYQAKDGISDVVWSKYRNRFCSKRLRVRRELRAMI
jgi:hypothetical protein